MNRFRIIPQLLIEQGGLVKGVKFKNHRYVGDPLNAVSIFNDKEVDEIAIVDRSAHSGGIDFDMIEKLASQAFMPLAYGGGISCIEDVVRLLRSGIEKVIINSAAFARPGLITEIAGRFGSSAVIAAIDAKAGLWGGQKAWCGNATQRTDKDITGYAMQLEAAGAGELLLTSVDREGSMSGFDLTLIRKVSEALSIPVIAGGGAGNTAHLKEAIAHGASAVAIGSMCVFWGRHKAVLINYPAYNDEENQV